MTSLANAGCPYPGPRPFEPGEQSSFFGRDAEIAELTSLIIAHRVVLVYAQSGAGKTSLLNAGLIPSLEEQGFVVLPPVRVRGLVPDDLAAQTSNIFVSNTLMCWYDGASDSRTILSASIPDFLKARGHPVDEQGFSAPYVMVFDQFEELFAFYPERWNEREGFVRQIGQALNDDPLLHAVFVMREDYAASLDPYAHLLPGRFDTRYRLERLRPRAACEAAEGPLRTTRRTFAPDVAAQLIDQLLAIRVENATGRTVEVKGEFVEPVQLQIAAESLWNELPADVTTISAEHLRAFSDVNQALSEFYENILDKTSSETGISARDLREWCDHHLITPSGTRGTVFRGMETTEGIPNHAVDLLENGHLIRAEMRAGGRWYELTHDRFIRPIQASNEAWRQRTHEARIRGQMRTLFGKASLVALVVLTLGAVSVFSYTQWRASQHARAREFAANALLPSIDPEQGLCLALSAAQLGGSDEVARIESALRQALRESRVRKVFRSDDGPILTTVFSPDGRWLVATASEDDTVKVWDRDRNDVSTLTGRAAEVGSAAFSPDGELIVTTFVDGTAQVSTTSTGEPLFELSEDGYFLSQPQFSADGRLILTASSDDTVWVWSVATRTRVMVVRGHQEPVTAAAFSRDGTRVVTASLDNTARIWDLRSGKQLLELVGHRQPLTDARFAPDGTTVLTASEDATARLWDAANGSTLAELRGHAGRVYSASFGPDGTTIVTASDDGTARTWLTATGTPVATLRGHQGAVLHAAFNPDGRQVVTASLDGTSRLWDVGEGWIASMPRQVAVTRISFSSDSKYVITEGQDGIVHASDARTGHSVSASAVGKAEAAGILSTEGSPDDQWLESLGDAGPASLLSSSADGRTILLATATTVGVWDVTTRRRMALLDGHTGWVTSGAFGPDATRVATASTDQTVRVWPVNSDGRPVVLPQPDGVTTVTFPRGPAAVESAATIGNLVLTTSPSGIARVWDVNAGRIIMQLHGLGDVMAAFSPDGTRVATARANGAVETYACETCGALEHLRRLAQARIITKACDGQ